MIIVYIFEHTTVQDFLDIIDITRQYEYVFEGEVINEIPAYYFMITLGLDTNPIIIKREKQPPMEDRNDPDYRQRETAPRVYRV